MTRVYVSSTYTDLVQARSSVSRALRDAGCEVVAMEDYAATGRPPLDKCLADVRSSDIYVGIVAWRYGFVPPGEKHSITEAEYREAVRLNIPCLLFLLDEDAMWPRKLIDRDEGPIEALRDDMTKRYLVKFFESVEELPELVKAAVAEQQHEADAAMGKTHFLRSPWLGIEFWQGDIKNPMLSAAPEVIRVLMRQSPFEMRVAAVSKDESVMVCASYDETIFGQVAPDVPIDSVPFFRPGTGMADTSFGSAELVVDAEAHNHLDWGGRLMPRPEGGGVALFHSVHASDEENGIPRNKDVFVVVHVRSYPTTDGLVRAGTFERFILSF